MGTAQSNGEKAMAAEDREKAFKLDCLSEREAWLDQFLPDSLCDYTVLRKGISAERQRAAKAVDVAGASAEGRCLGAVLGLAIGDALGAPLEFSNLRYGEAELTEMAQPGIWDMDHTMESGVKLNKLGYNSFRLQPGQWTDDTAMALCLADSLLVCRGFDALDLRLRFLNWWHFGYNNAFAKDTERRESHFHGASCGLGGNIAGSMREFIAEQKECTAAGDRFTSGNGSIMRLAPCAVFFRDDYAAVLAVAERQSRTTHRGEEAAECSRLLAHLLVGAFRGLPAASEPRGERSREAAAPGRGSLRRPRASSEPKQPGAAGRAARGSVQSTRSPGAAASSPAQRTRGGAAASGSAQRARSPGGTARVQQPADGRPAVGAAELKSWLLGEWCSSFKSRLYSVGCLAASTTESRLTAEAASGFGLGDYIVVAKSMEVRKNADRQSEVLEEIPQDTPVHVDRICEGWLLLSEPHAGWVDGFVDELGEPRLTKPGWPGERNWNWKAEDFHYAPKRAENSPDYIGSYALDCLGMALHCIWTTDGYSAAVLKAANLRGDADTVGAVTGQLAGAIYGSAAIPKAWREHLEKWDEGDVAFKAWLLYHRRDEPLLSRALTEIRRPATFEESGEAVELSSQVFSEMNAKCRGDARADFWKQCVKPALPDGFVSGATPPRKGSDWTALCSAVFDVVGSAKLVEILSDLLAKMAEVCPDAVDAEPSASPERDWSKLERNLAALAAEKGSKWQPIVLLSTGSLCPVHRGHVEMFSMARRALEKENPDLAVVGGFLSPSHDDYVRPKIAGHSADEATARSHGWLDSKQRLDLVKMAVAEDDIVAADGWEASQGAFSNWPQVADSFSKDLAQRHPECRLLYLCGEDLGSAFAETGMGRSWGTCVVTRPGRGALEGKCGSYRGNYIVPGGSVDLSSTAVRACFESGVAKDACQLLHPAVYLKLRKRGYMRSCDLSPSEEEELETTAATSRAARLAEAEAPAASKTPANPCRISAGASQQGSAAKQSSKSPAALKR